MSEEAPRRRYRLWMLAWVPALGVACVIGFWAIIAWFVSAVALSVWVGEDPDEMCPWL